MHCFIFPGTPYSEVLSIAGVQLRQLRVHSNKNHKLHGSLPRNNNDNNLRNKRTYNITFCTQPYKNSFITYNAMKM